MAPTGGAPSSTPSSGAPGGFLRQARFPGAPDPASAAARALGRSRPTTMSAGESSAAGPGSGHPRDPPAPAPAPAPPIASITTATTTTSAVAAKPKPPKRDRCLVELLRELLERRRMPAKLANRLPKWNEPHFCCSEDDKVRAKHAEAHAADAPDGVDAVVEMLKNEAKPFAVVAEELVAAAKEGRIANEECFVDEEPVKLSCPISCARLECPGKGRDCKHLECFDLRTFVRVNLRALRVLKYTECVAPDKKPTCHRFHTEKKPRGECEYCRAWRCPLCRVPTSIADLRYDAFVARILAREPEAKRVTVKHSTAQWVAVEEEEEDGDEDESDSGEGRGQGEGEGEDGRRLSWAEKYMGKGKAEEEVIILDSDDENQDDGGGGGNGGNGG